MSRNNRIWLAVALSKLSLTTHRYIDADQLLGSAMLISPDQADDMGDLESLEELDDAFLGQTARGYQNTGMPMPMGGRPRRMHRGRQNSLSSRLMSATHSDKTAIILIQSPCATQSSSTHAPQVKRQVPYLPLFQHYSRSSKYSQYGILPSHLNHIQRAASDKRWPTSTVTWPPNRIPVELFELIAAQLARDDIKSLRLVSKEFERKVCQPLFRTAVVPFNTELYDMIVDDKKAIGREKPPRYKGKGKKKASSADAATWGWRNAKEDKDGKVYLGHGLRVFQGFGPYIRRFGMSFEVSESQLSSPPLKQILDSVDSYHGTYEWPSINYARFAKLNRLEETADDTSRMKAAFSNLTTVSELGLCMRNGLGWLEGPDKSFYASLMQRQQAVFGGFQRPKDHALNSAREILSCLRQCVQRSAPGSSFMELTVEQHALPTPLDQIDGLQGTIFADAGLWQGLDQDISEPLETGTNPSSKSPLPSDWIKTLRASSDVSGATNPVDVGLHPSELKREQKEWLLETEWAQRAFLESYILAVMDNPCVFSMVSTLKLATLSSGLLALIARDMFWDALPSLTNVVVHVSPDWRTVQKDEASYAETKLQDPSEAVRGFYELLRDQIACRENIIRLTLGWADGGEHAQGLYARNTHVLPAPIASLDQSTAANPAQLLVFPHLVHLTLSNCWMTPTILERLVMSHSESALRKLTLESVSLTAHPNASTPAQQAQAAMAAMANLQAQLPNLPNAQPQFQQAMAQHFQAHMQQMQQLLNQPGAAASPPMGGPPVIPIPAGLNPFGANLNQQLHMLPPHPPQVQSFAQPPPVNPTYWMNDHRQGCWPELINKISPGPIFSDYLPEPQPWEDPRPVRPSTNLQTLELISCGYVSLDHNNTFDQTALMAGLETSRERSMTSWFRARYLALKPYMLDGSNDKFLGSIVQWIPRRELDAMHYAWGLQVGWRDREKAEEAEFDGCRPGGTGRVSGFIEKGMPLMTQHLAASASQSGTLGSST